MQQVGGNYFGPIYLCMVPAVFDICRLFFVPSDTRLGHLLLRLVLVQADGEPEHNFLYICTNVMSFELFNGRNNYFECIADER